ncbi:MAG: TonB-dependent receptor, partial [Saprospiraceae bacterium]
SSYLPVCLLLLACQLLSAQNPGKTTIKGVVSDTLDSEMAFATVMLLNPKDTTLVNFTRSDEKGAFSFKNVRNVDYLLKISYIGYLPYQQHLNPSPEETSDLGSVRIKPISTELMEVVIRTAKAPLRIHGDTIEYDASTFKVPPGSTVEDLLRRLPGIEVDADGNIRAQGQDIKRVYVDGKTFFGDDPKSATKNLGAETISKVQVYDEKSEQSKLTGVDDGKKEKAMNLEMKDEFKKGSFGKVTAAVGSSDRWAARGNYNRFDQKQQLSFIGYGNNINQTGVNWEDYGEFQGQNTFGNYDNGDFGFDGGGRNWYSSSDDGITNNFDGRGFTKNYGAGTNYNFDNKKTKFNASYFYNQTALQLDQYGFRQNFLPEGSFINFDTTHQGEFRGNHSIGTRFERDLDSSNVLIVKANARLSKNTKDFQQSQLFFNADQQPNNRLGLNNDNDLDSWNLQSAAIFRHRFHKKGRSLALSGGYNGSHSDGRENLLSLNRFFEAQSFTEQVRLLNANDNRTDNYKSSALFTESLAKKWFWETFLNFSQTDNQVNRQTSDPSVGSERIDSLSVYYDQQTRYERLGTSLRYSYKGLNASAGLAAQQIVLTGEYSRDRGLLILTAPLHRTFNNLTPNVSMNYEFTNNMNVSFDYSYGISAPELNDLQPVPNVNNPAFRIEGNPDLTPARQHNLYLHFNYWNPANFS